MKIFFSNLSFIKSNSVARKIPFGRNIANDNFEFSKTKINHNDPKEQEYDKHLGREIQRLKREIEDTEKLYNNAIDVTAKEQLSDKITKLQDQKYHYVDELVNRHIAFAQKVASDDFFNSNNRNDWEDIISFAYMGLFRAADNFDPDKNPDVHFITYAAKAIKRLINLEQSKNKIIRIPINTYIAGRKLIRTKKDLAKKTGKEITDEELAKILGRKSVKKLKETMDIDMTTLPLNKPIAQNSKETLENYIPDNNPKNNSSANIEDAENRKQLRTLINKVLTPREALILTMRYRLNEPNSDNTSLVTLAAISDVIGLTKERIRQLERDAIAKLRRAVDHGNDA